MVRQERYLPKSEPRILGPSTDGDRSVGKEKELPLEELQYLAGSFDSGNWIGLSDSGNVRVRIGRKEKELLLPFEQYFSTGLHQARNGGWFLDATGLSTLPFFIAVMPYLRLCKDKVQCAILIGTTTGDEKQSHIMQLERLQESKISDVDIGEEPLTNPYVGGFFDKRKLKTDGDGYFMFEVHLRNVSFIQLLKEQLGGSTYPKESVTPTTWKIVGKAAEILLSRVRPFLRVREKDIDYFMAYDVRRVPPKAP